MRPLLIVRFFIFIRYIFEQNYIISQLIARDFKTRYLGSFLGLFWAFIHPLVTTLIFVFVFTVGFKAQPINNFPFVLWLFAGIVPWFFFADALGSASNAILEYRFLVKNIAFKSAVLPIVKVFSTALIHMVFIVLVLLLFSAYGYKPSLYWLQLSYYLFALIVLLVGLTWITSSIIVFLKDIGQVISIFIQFGFWLTPIFWSLDLLPKSYHFIIKLNPVLYIVDGYRNCLVYNIWFWERPLYTAYFWLVAIMLFVGGAVLFRRLQPHFSDSL